MWISAQWDFACVSFNSLSYEEYNCFEKTRAKAGIGRECRVFNAKRVLPSTPHFFMIRQIASCGRRLSELDAMNTPKTKRRKRLNELETLLLTPDQVVGGRFRSPPSQVRWQATNLDSSVGDDNSSGSETIDPTENVANAKKYSVGNTYSSANSSASSDASISNDMGNNSDIDDENDGMSESTAAGSYSFESSPENSQETMVPNESPLLDMENDKNCNRIVDYGSLKRTIESQFICRRCVRKFLAKKVDK